MDAEKGDPKKGTDPFSDTAAEKRDRPLFQIPSSAS
jgi:hypothetical protein